MITLYTSRDRENPYTTCYPMGISVHNVEDLRTAVTCDYVCARYRNNTRSKANFISSNCLCMDCDNDHTDQFEDWVTPEDVKAVFPDVEFFVHFSRNHLKEKHGKDPRPKFHILFPINEVDDENVYAEMKRTVHSIFPCFDRRALDSARSFFGTDDPKVEYYSGSRNLTAFLVQYQSVTADPKHVKDAIHEGQRNSTLYANAVKALKRYGNNETAYAVFIADSEKCVPPLPETELSAIWASALKFYAKIAVEDSYIPPDQYNHLMKKKLHAEEATKSHKPSDYSDLGQAAALAMHFGDCICYTSGNGYWCYDGIRWVEGHTRAQAYAQELTTLQLQEANAEKAAAMKLMTTTGAKYLLEAGAVKSMNAEQKDAYAALKSAEEYEKYVLKRRNSPSIRAALNELKPKVEIAPDMLDQDPYALCTPAGTFDLRHGLEGIRPHSATDYITKVTAVSPGEKGAQLWQDQLNCVFCNDQELINYVQLVCGTALIGQVKIEALIIANGCGRNGKSTFWNVIARALGEYSGAISADALTANCRHNIRPELAELRGKRLVIAAEMREGARLDDGTTKKIASTDKIAAEKKYKDPMSFTPSHTVVLYTNHLPKVSASDDGTWRRLWIIPFDAKIEGAGDKKNYAEYLYQEAGEAILTWLVEGAKKAYEVEYNFPVPARVQQAIRTYREENDWLAHFLEDRCDIETSFREASGLLYTEYRSYSTTYGEHVRSTADFYRALEAAGFVRQKRDGRKYFSGLRLKPFDATM